MPKIKSESGLTVCGIEIPTDSMVTTVDQMKELLGWKEEPENSDWGEDYLCKDMNGKKIRLTKNKTNRPFKAAIAKRYMLEHLRGKWAMNGETLVIDKKGNTQSAQHRGVGFILAEQKRLQNPEHWEQFIGSDELTAQFLIVRGISDKDEVVNTLDRGQSRQLGDVLYRTTKFENVNGDVKRKSTLNKLLANATRLVWLRAGGRMVSDAPHFPHSEALDFLELHPRIQEAVEFITIRDSKGEGKQISTYLSLGYAAGLMYLMGTSDTVNETDATTGAVTTGETDFAKWEKASTFWNKFATGANLDAGNPILVLRNLLLKQGAGDGSGRDAICGMVIKAWLCWIAGEKDVKGADIKVKKDADGKFSETPRIGGLDIDRPKPAKAGKGEKGPKLPKKDSIRCRILEALSTKGELSASGVKEALELGYGPKPTLDKEVEAGHLSSAVYPDGDKDGPTMYSITDKGKSLLETAV